MEDGRKQGLSHIIGGFSVQILSLVYFPFASVGLNGTNSLGLGVFTPAGRLVSVCLIWIHFPGHSLTSSPGGVLLQQRQLFSLPGFDHPTAFLKSLRGSCCESLDEGH